MTVALQALQHCPLLTGCELLPKPSSFLPQIEHVLVLLLDMLPPPHRIGLRAIIFAHKLFVFAGVMLASELEDAQAFVGHSRRNVASPKPKL
jgi:hypothetical protein